MFAHGEVTWIIRGYRMRGESSRHLKSLSHTMETRFSDGLAERITSGLPSSPSLNVIDHWIASHDPSVHQPASRATLS
jgi:hypothetical protein